MSDNWYAFFVILGAVAFGIVFGICVAVVVTNFTACKPG